MDYVTHITSERELRVHGDVWHNGNNRLAIVVEVEGWPPIAYVSGINSWLNAKKALETCSTWQEIPLAIEAVYAIPVFYLVDHDEWRIANW